jgi:SPP1 gp7 family putative phage head morphogenesis protein
MSRAMRQELEQAPTGILLGEFMDEQAGLITSLPIQAGQRVHRLAIEALSTSGRANEIAAAIMRSGDVTKSRANVIARTSISTAWSGLTMTRATSIGSTAYSWRTSRDADVRPSHARMEGRPVDWSNPPTLDGLTGHAGMLPNCRCWPDPIIPGLDFGDAA